MFRPISSTPETGIMRTVFSSVSSGITGERSSVVAIRCFKAGLFLGRRFWFIFLRLELLLGRPPAEREGFPVRSDGRVELPAVRVCAGRPCWRLLEGVEGLEGDEEDEGAEAAGAFFSESPGVFGFCCGFI